MVPVERNGHITVYPDTLLDCFRVFLAEKNCLPGKDMFGLMEIAVRHKRQPLQTDGIEDIIPIGDFPGVEQWSVLVNVLPKIERVLSPMRLELMRVRSDGESRLTVNLCDGPSDTQAGINWAFQVNG